MDGQARRCYRETLIIVDVVDWARATVSLHPTGYHLPSTDGGRIVPRILRLRKEMQLALCMSAWFGSDVMDDETW